MVFGLYNPNYIGRARNQYGGKRRSLTLPKKILERQVVDGDQTGDK